VLRPLCLETKAILNMKPRQDNYKKPMFDFIILLESLGLSLNRPQVVFRDWDIRLFCESKPVELFKYFDLVDMLNTIDQMALYAKYQKYRPADHEAQAKWKQRWSYAYRAITEGQIRPKREQYKWATIQLVTRLRREYVNLLKKKIVKGAKLTNAELETERVWIEKNLKLFFQSFRLTWFKKKKCKET